MAQETEILTRLSAPLLRWYDENRRVLPWREEVSAYRTWVSEIMLQQTRVAAVLPYFERFMAAFPDVAALAAAEPDRLMKLWEGLGYYSRARNRHGAVRRAVSADVRRTLCPAGHRRLYGGGDSLHRVRAGRSRGRWQRPARRRAHHGERTRHSGHEEPPHVPRVDGRGDEPRAARRIQSGADGSRRDGLHAGR